MHRRRFIHAENAEGLIAFRPVEHFADDARAFVRGLEPVTTQARHMEKDIGQAVVGDDEPIALRRVKPFDDARDLDQIDRILFTLFNTKWKFGSDFRPHPPHAPAFIRTLPA